MKKIINIRTVTCFIGIALMALITSCDYTETNSNSAENEYIHTEGIPKEYSNLFTPQAIKKFDLLFTQLAKSGSKISAFNYNLLGSDGRAYSNQFEVFKVNLTDDKPLSEIIHIIPANNIKNVTEAESMTLISGEILFRYKDGIGSTTKNVELNFDGNSLKINKQQDDLLYLSFRFNKINISYDNGCEFEIKRHGVILLNEDGKLIFLKKNKVLYMIFIYEQGMLPEKPDTTLDLLN